MARTVLERIARQARIIDDARVERWRGASIEEHAVALLELLELTDRLYSGRALPHPEPRSEEALALWRTLVRQGRR